VSTLDTAPVAEAIDTVLRVTHLSVDYATRRGYDGKVLPMPGKAYKGSPQHLAVQASQDLGVHVSQLRD